MVDEASVEQRKGLSAITAVLPRPKALLARRLVAQARIGCGEFVPDQVADDFHRMGLTLSPVELGLLEEWLAKGLHTSVCEETRSSDGTVKLLLQLEDGKKVETVAMPVGACCVSSQVGCAVGCKFCASGLFGVERHLTTDEIVEQVVHARRQMLTAVARMKDELMISPRRQTLSTVGGVKPLEKMMAAEVRPCLALSLHTADEAKRSELLPRAHKDPLRDIVAAADAYGREIGTPIQIEWTLLRGINDSPEDVEKLCDLLQGVRGYVNFIVYNPVDGLSFASPNRERIVAMVNEVKARGILAKIRDSSGPDAQAACGQLRLRDRS